MAKRTGKARTVTIVDDDDDDPTPSVETAQAAADFAELNRDEGGALIRITDELRTTAGASVQIVRTYPATPDMKGHVGNMTPDEYSPERVRQLYGPGQYRIRFVGPNGYLPGGGALHIARMRDEAAGPVSGGDVASQVAALLKATRDSDEAREKEKTARRDRLLELAIPGMFTLLGSLLTGRGGDTGQLIATLATAMKPAPGMTAQDMLSMVVKVQELTKPAESGNQLDQLERIVTLAKDFAGDAGGAEGWAGVARELVREGLPAAKAAFEAISQERRQAPQLPPQVRMPTAAPQLPPQPSAPAQPVPAPQVPQPSAPAQPVPAPQVQPGDDMLAMFMPMIREQAKRVLVWAAQDRNPSAYAEVLLDELPDYVAQYLPPPKMLEMLNHQNWWAVVLEKFPEAAPHQQWLDDFRTELIATLRAHMRSAATDTGPLTDAGQDSGEPE